MKNKYAFIDRDGTLIVEPKDKQIDSLEKLTLMPGVISSLQTLQAVGYRLVMVSNQDGLGTSAFPESDFWSVQKWLMDLFTSQGIFFEDVRICPHLPEDQCQCRKPAVGLVLDYLREQNICRQSSYVIGDRKTDLVLAENMGIRGIQIGSDSCETWEEVLEVILKSPRMATVKRSTKETAIEISIALDNRTKVAINTGIGFFDHMLMQLASHGGFSLQVEVKGDYEVDDHHTVEDTALAIGEALRQALGDKRGIGRYGFLLPMDESLAQVAIDICGRSSFMFQGAFSREKVGELSTECVPHFFRSFAEALGAALHIQVTGENSHHMVESIFKAVGRTLRQAINKNGNEMPSTKGVL